MELWSSWICQVSVATSGGVGNERVETVMARCVSRLTSLQRSTTSVPPSKLRYGTLRRCRVWCHSRRGVLNDVDNSHRRSEYTECSELISSI
jgi:hypothetical protein